MPLLPSRTGRLHALALVCLSSALLAACSGGSGSSGNASGSAAASRMLLSSADGGANLLGSITELPAAATGAPAVFATFDGTPWIANVDSLSGHGLVFNTADNKFYAVLSGAGADQLGVLVRFDPATDTLTALKSFARRSYPDVTGVNGETLAFEQPTGFFRLPLPSPDGKSLLLRASDGGVDNRGALRQRSFCRRARVTAREAIARIVPIDRGAATAARTRIDALTKPPGSRNQKPYRRLLPKSSF